jgi:hypothetical protein
MRGVPALDERALLPPTLLVALALTVAHIAQRLVG